MTTTAMTVRDALDAASTAIEAAGASTPRLDAELLVADAVAVDRAKLFIDPELEVPPASARVLAENVRRRVQREPVAYILGRRGFRYLELAVDPRAIIPRPETELLVELALDLPEGARVHDVGTGAGAIALALLHERPDLRVTASEPYEPAAAVARENAARLGLPLEISSDFGLPAGEFDLVLANLPYVPEGDWEGMQLEIRRYEPREAFVSGPDGLDAIRQLIEQAEPGTRLGLEHGGEQGPAVRELLADAETYPDLARWDRITVGRVP